MSAADFLADAARRTASADAIERSRTEYASMPITAAARIVAANVARAPEAETREAREC